MVSSKNTHAQCCIVMEACVLNSPDGPENKEDISESTLLREESDHQNGGTLTTTDGYGAHG